MQRLIKRLLTPRFTAALLFIALASPLFGRPVDADTRTITFPKKNPTFTISVPADWTSKVDKDGDIECRSDDGSDFGFTIMIAKDIESLADLKEFLPKMADEIATGAKLKKVKIGDLSEGKSPDGISMAVLETVGKIQGEDFIITLMGFTPARGKYYILMTSEGAEVDKAHQKDMSKIVDSIKKAE